LLLSSRKYKALIPKIATGNLMVFLTGITVKEILLEQQSLDEQDS